VSVKVRYETKSSTIVWNDSLRSAKRIAPSWYGRRLCRGIVRARFIIFYATSCTRFSFGCVFWAGVAHGHRLCFVSFCVGHGSQLTGKRLFFCSCISKTFETIRGVESGHVHKTTTRTLTHIHQLAFNLEHSELNAAFQSLAAISRTVPSISCPLAECQPRARIFRPPIQCPKWASSDEDRNRIRRKSAVVHELTHNSNTGTRTFGSLVKKQKARAHTCQQHP